MNSISTAWSRWSVRAISWKENGRVIAKYVPLKGVTEKSTMVALAEIPEEVRPGSKASAALIFVIWAGLGGIFVRLLATV